MAESENAVTALREYANAIRGDWGSIDGRSVKGDLNAIADALDGSLFPADDSLTAWRERLGICPSGEGHWTYHCSVRDCGNEGSRW